MAISKTNFINYTRCPRYTALEEIKKEKLEADLTYSDYLCEEKEDVLCEIVGEMYETDENGNEVNLIDIKNDQLEAMLPYYKKVEDLAGKATKKIFGGKAVYAEDTFSQECFDFTKNGIKYKCYIDIYNEVKNTINIIEVKATTTNKFLSLGGNLRGLDRSSIFHKKNNILYLKDEINYDYTNEMDIKTYEKQKEKLLNRFGVGRYVFDLAVQRYFIENEFKQSNNEKSLNKIHYYLAVLNHEYEYDGKSDYETDIYGNEIINFIDMTKITESLQNSIDTYRVLLEKYLKDNNIKKVDLGIYCEYKQQTQCQYFKQVCGSMIPKKNSSLNYLNNPAGFKDEIGIHHKGLDLINEGYLEMLDIPITWIKNPNHIIQREALEFKKPLINKEKIKAAINSIAYPIYHLDFETFPCPIPRFYKEHPYDQSPFQFSLHIENSPSVCDKEKDNYYYLVHTFEDEREGIAKKLCELIPGDKGTLFAQNVSFEKSVIKKLSNIYPQYKDQLLAIRARGFDLIDILKTKKDLYLDLGFSEEEAAKLNYYDYRFTGSYSIKKTLPVFSDLKYDDLEIKNGVSAIVEYSAFKVKTKEEIERSRLDLIEYCKQDTWAMVVILDALRRCVK